ncbi:HAMP domain-containing sensor histidine kinase [Candidatus Mycobacterium wuenschmannii]|uniref:histidine kinase n=1 Tax=Candidatus Mycobacterium wuenschmannii TaxID=3027808 RepID=A0ABY8VPY6_9MYCO|nr:HAMP domain-containing sensor histidine kinase [Candidatus Mycobacterium wuenschmannii]WIM85699.1 HAMP domain-containing sensor histidine kinase [Candidatus Mycobacterium wuenschmannii]
MTGAPKTPWWRPRTLRHQLVLGVSAVVTVVILVVGAISVLSLRSYVNAMNDTEVSESLDALEHSYARYRAGDISRNRDIEHAMLRFTEQNPLNVIAVLRGGNVIGSAVFFENDPRPATPDVIAAIKRLPLHDNEIHNTKLGGLGPYRVSSQTTASGDVLMVGVSLDLVNKTINRRIISETVLSVAALLVTSGLTALVVGYALRPLRRVAVTAAEVAGTQLTGDDHRIRPRVQPDDTDPDNEVGIVGHTLNRLLDNVDSALAHRAESDRRMRQFITDASHELRTPLAAISGYSELTRQDSEALPPTTEYALARIEAEARRMTSLVDELLLLSRLGEGDDLRTEEVDLADIVLNAFNDAAVAAPSHEWIKDLPDDPVWVIGDSDRLHQLVSNLLTNAWVHTPEGVSVTAAITCHRYRTGGPYAELTVANDGPDIDPELLPHLFDRFVRAKDASTELGGNGLGLAIVDSIVKAHDGTVVAESARGRTIFRVRLPLAK